MMRRTALVVVAAVVSVFWTAACGGTVAEEAAPKTPVPATEPPATAPADTPVDAPADAAADATAEQLRSCVKILDTIGGVAPASRMKQLAQGCPNVCPGGQSILAEGSMKGSLTLELAECGFYCSEEAHKKVIAAPVRDRAATAIAECGAARYGLAEDQGSMLSLEWFVAQRVGKWLADARKQCESSHAELVAELDDVLADLRLPLSLPAKLPATYELPSVTNAEYAWSRTYVVVTPDRVTVAATPVAVLTEDGARIADDAGGLLPGSPTDLATLPAEITRLEALSPVRDVRPSYYAEGEEPPPDDADDPPFVHKPILSRADLERYGGAGEDLAAVLAPDRNAPLVLADAKLPATRMLEAISALGWRGGRLGAVRDSGAAGYVRLGIAVARVPAKGFAPGLMVLVDDKGYLLIGHKTAPQRIPKLGSEYDFDGLYVALKKSSSPYIGMKVNSDGIFLAVDGSATVQQLTRTVEVVGEGPYNWVRATPLSVAKVWIKKAVRRKKPMVWSPGPQAKVDIGKPVATEGLHKMVIRRYFRRKLVAVKRCYEKQLLKDPKLAGKLDVTYEISSTGAVQNVVVEGLNEEVRACVRPLIEAIPYPAPQGGVTVKVQYPLTFRTARR